MVIRVIGVTDFHGQLTQAAALVATIDELRSAVEHSVVVGVGDVVGWSQPESELTGDEYALQVLDHAGLVASTIGNHELDRGIADFRRIEAAAAFPYLCANVVDEHTGRQILPGSTVAEVGGVPVGIVGAVTTTVTQHVGPEKFRGLVVQEIAEATNREVARLAAQGVRVIVAAPHEGVRPVGDGSYAGPLQDVAERIAPEVDLILGGHYHHELVYAVPDPNGDLRPVAQAGSHGSALVVADLVVDDATGSVDRAGSTVRVRPVAMDGPGDPEVQRIVDRAYTEASRLGGRVVGRVRGAILRPRTEDGAVADGRESAIDNLTADAQLDWVRRNVPGGADLAVTSNWLTHGDLPFRAPDGEITWRDVWEVQKRGPSVLVVSMTGREIEAMFRQQWPEPPAWRPTLGVSHNVAYVRDPDRRVVPGGAAAESFVVSGELLDRDRTYRVAINSTLARGIDDHFPVFTGIGLDRRHDTGVLASSVLAYYLDRYAPGPDGLTGRVHTPADLVGN